MDKMLHVSVSPHIHGKKSTTGIMLDVILALLPASVAGVLLFGLSALWVIATCVVTAVACEALLNLIVKKEQTVLDFSAVVTGPQLQVENIRPSEVTAYVDVSGLEPGEHILPVAFHVEDRDVQDLTFEATPSTIAVTIFED